MRLNFFLGGGGTRERRDSPRARLGCCNLQRRQHTASRRQQHKNTLRVAKSIGQRGCRARRANGSLHHVIESRGMQRDSGRALVNLQRRLERQFFEGSRLDAATKHWVVQVYQSVADVVGDSLAVTAAFDVISALNTGALLWHPPSSS
jgi:hypothetical protein